MTFIRRSLLALSIVAACAATAAAQTQPVSHETVAVSTITAVGFATTTLNPAGVGQVSSCLVTIETGAVRMWLDRSTTPTSTSGLGYSPGTQLFIVGNLALSQLRAIAIGQSATMQAQCMRGPDISSTNPPITVVYDPAMLIGQQCNSLLRAAGSCR